MGTDPNTLFREPSPLFMDLPLRVDPTTVPVADELKKLEKSRGQLADEIIAEIDSLHEPRFMDGYPKEMCAECWTEWPCGTHLTIYGEDKTSCVHGIRSRT